MTDPCTDSTASGPLSFEDALSELKAITQRLEDGTQGLEASLAEFERGVRLLRTCYSLLETAEQRIELLIGFDEQGQPQTKPFDATATAAQPGQTAGKRRSGTARKGQAEIGFVETPP